MCEVIAASHGTPPDHSTQRPALRATADAERLTTFSDGESERNGKPTGWAPPSFSSGRSDDGEARPNSRSGIAATGSTRP
jgi:hypothetical protein